MVDGTIEAPFETAANPLTLIVESVKDPVVPCEPNFSLHPLKVKITEVWPSW
jgi:hypothetical protein